MDKSYRKKLSEGHRIRVYAFNVAVPPGIGYYDTLIIVPFCSSVKEGDKVYCYQSSGRMYQNEVVYLRKIEGGKFYVSRDVESDLIEVPFESLLGIVREIIKQKTAETENRRRNYLRLV